MCHAVRQMMDPDPEEQPPLDCIVELDEKYFGGKPRHKVCVRFQRGKCTRKKCVFIAVERKGSVCSALVDSYKSSDVLPRVNQFVQKSACLMTDENHSYRKIGKQYVARSCVKHAMEEFARGDTHNNTAESFNSLLERAKQGVFHYIYEYKAFASLSKRNRFPLG